MKILLLPTSLDNLLTNNCFNYLNLLILYDNDYYQIYEWGIFMKTKSN